MKSRYLIATVLASGLAVFNANKANAVEGSAELILGNNSSTLDIKLSEDFTKIFGFFGRNIAKVDHKNQVSNFTIVDITMKGYKGLASVAEFQYDQDIGLVPRLGAEYYFERGNFNLFLLATAGIKEGDIQIVTNLQYTPRIVDKKQIFGNLEAVTGLSKNGHDYSIQKIRLGLKMDSNILGIGLELNEDGNEGEISYNLGPFYLRKF
ncbi:hypothetical protein J4230_03065 [Candidatus Woesearchaeota archaeon]|nr:hypothetical protein [Candidatus Woesearchaeota archaeon]